MSDSRLFKSKKARQLLAEVTLAAEESSKILTKYKEISEDNWSKAESDLRKAILKHEKENYEYLALARLDGRIMIHINPLREGLMKNSEEDLKATGVKEPTLQLYHRDTGEVLIDAAAPIIANGSHQFAVRAATVVTSSSILGQFFIWNVIPSMSILALLLYFLPKEPWIGFIGSIITSLITSILLTNRWKKELFRIKRGLQVLTRGDTNVKLQPDFKHELGQVVYETNNVAIGLKNHIIELTEQIKNLKKNSDIVHNNGIESERSASKVKGASNQIKQSSENQSIHIDSISSLIEELAATFEQVSANTQEVATSSQNVHQMGIEGESQMDDLQREMSGLQTSFQQITQATNNLITSMNDIEKFIKIIENIAEQTNILALNATIEAARAGHEGKGFAVVADEVRKLAHESASAASEIGKLVEKAQVEKKNSEDSINNGTDSLEHVTKALYRSQKVFTDISSKITAVNHGIEEVSIAIQSVTSGTTDTADSIMEVSQMSEKIMDEIGQLNEMINLQQKIAAELNESSKELDKITVHISHIVSRFKV